MQKQVAAEKHNYVRSSLAKGIPYCTEKNTLSAKHTGPHPLSTMARDKKGGKACRGSTKLVRISRGSTIASHREKIQRHPTTQDRHRRTNTQRDPPTQTHKQRQPLPLADTFTHTENNITSSLHSPRPSCQQSPHIRVRSTKTQISHVQQKVLRVNF